MGITVTTPRLSFAGSGDTGFDSTAVGQDIDRNGNAITEVATNTQNGLSADFQSPFSLAIGGAYALGATRLHLVTEWFAAVDEFVILPSEPFVGQTSGELINTAITRELNMSSMRQSPRMEASAPTSAESTRTRTPSFRLRTGTSITSPEARR